MYTCQQLIAHGKYKGNICLVIGDDLYNSPLLNCEFIQQNNIIIKYFQNIPFSQEFTTIQKNDETPTSLVYEAVSIS
jgi:hypothetical protein